LDYKENRCIDLHIHSSASDGTLTPAEIITLAQELGLAAISITDHDTLAGSKEAFRLTIPATIELVSGVEISAAPMVPSDAVSSYHILGYFFRLDDPKLNQTLRQLQHFRRTRNEQILQRLNSLGVRIELADLETALTGGEVGRPHIATALIQNNIVDSVEEAFNQYLGQGKPAYVDKKRLSCQEAIQIISEAGGVPILAHPGLLDIDPEDELEKRIVSLKQLGLKGIEVYYPEHSDQFVQQLLDIADAHDLLITGGSDFHGDLKPQVQMGIGYGNLHVPYDLFETLRSCVQAPDNLATLQETLAYRFKDTRILGEAVRHSSFVNELADPALRDNERFEFLGDAVLNLVVGHILMQRYPDLKEGDLTRIRANMVNETQLAAMAQSLNIGSHILLGKGEFLTGGHQKNSILADAMEAIIAAIYLDGGYPAASAMIENHFSALFDAVSTGVQFLDHKSELQEVVQLQHMQTPEYQIIAESGPDHDKTFSVQATIGDLKTIGKGKSKKAAEQDAARKALLSLKS
jgi:3',5'-nucleoside bisphosphate phosphatase